MTNYEKYVAAFQEAFPDGKEFENYCVKDVDEWTSIVHLALITAIEDSFDIMFDPEDIIEFDSFQKGLELLEKYEIEM